MEPKVQKLYDYIRERGTILPINDYSQELLSQDDVHKRVAESIRSGEPLQLTHVMTLHPCAMSWDQDPKQLDVSPAVITATHDLTDVMTLHFCDASRPGISGSWMCHLRVLKLHMVADGRELHFFLDAMLDELTVNY